MTIEHYIGNNEVGMKIALRYFLVVPNRFKDNTNVT